MCVHSNADAICYVQVQSVRAVRYVQLDGSAGGQIKTGYNLKAVRDLFFTCWVINCQWAGSRVCPQQR